MNVQHGVLRAVPEGEQELQDRFWCGRRHTNSAVTLHAQHQHLVSTGRLENFARAAGLRPGPFQGQRYDDSDVYKWIEAASAALRHGPEPELSRKLEEAIDLVAAAQREDGYLNTHVQLGREGDRWRNLGMGHELYCAGHLFEAAVAHHRATGAKRLLDVAERFLRCIDREFGAADGDAIPGHPEIERALQRLGDALGEPRAAQLAALFLERRGRRPSRFERELADPTTPGNHHDYRMLFLRRGAYSGSYAQDHAPILEHEDVVGHAVRAMYLYTAQTAQAARTGDAAAAAHMVRLFERLVERRTYLTGGIGSARANEGFTSDHDLPNQTAYAETCASIGLVLWAHQITLLTGDLRHADVMERTLHNGVLAGASHDGRRFFYENPLASAGDHHRKEWFDCACCPPNYSRLVQSLERFTAAVGERTLALLLLVGTRIETEVPGAGRVRLTVDSELPFGGRVAITIEECPAGAFQLLVREPSWCQGEVTVRAGGRALAPVRRAGALVLEGPFAAGTTLTLDFALPILRLEAHPLCENLAGKVALQRGPLVYCAEDTDHEGRLAELSFDPRAPLEARTDADLLGGVVRLHGRAVRRPHPGGDRNYVPRGGSGEDVPFTAIPYYAWDHREPGAMRVWLPVAPVA